MARKVTMALPRDFKETVAARVQNDPAFAQTLLDEVSSVLTAGSVASFIIETFVIHDITRAWLASSRRR